MYCVVRRLRRKRRRLLGRKGGGWEGVSALDRGTVLVTGYAKAPQGTSMYEVFKHVGIVLEIDPRTDTIVDAEFTVVTDVASRFLSEMLRGYNLRQGLEPLLTTIRQRYFAPSQEALIKAVRVAVQRYRDSVGSARIPDVEPNAIGEDFRRACRTRESGIANSNNSGVRFARVGRVK